VANIPFTIPIPADPSSPPVKLWSPEEPFLYNLTVQYGDDIVGSYFGMREISLCKDTDGVQRPCINGEWRFLAGFLDQSYWPDGIYTAPGEEALVYDVAVLKDFGMNFIRLHQKVR
jgi:beta-galactosidase/beta-glucuronidase